MFRGTLYRMAWFFYLALAMGGVVWIGLRTGEIPLELFVDPGSWWLDLLLGAATGLALLGLWEGARRLLPGALRLERELADLLRGLDPSEAIALALLSGFGEELFFRGAVQGAWGIVPATLLFALLHSGPGVAFRLWTLFAGIAGGALGALMLWRGNLLAPVTAHFLLNAINLHRLARSREQEEGGEPAGSGRLTAPNEAHLRKDEEKAETPQPREEGMAKSEDVLARIDREKEGYLEELKDYLRIPSISTDPAYKAEILRCSEFLLEKMGQAGLEAERIETRGNPLVYGEWSGAPGKPTLLFYGHYDVQPADPLELWRNPPFEPAVEGDNLVARGATDDKGQSFAHLKAVAATLAERGELPVNVKFLIEGEEESGGQSIEAYVQEDGGRRLATDIVVVSDSSMYAPGQPSLLYGLKGLAYMEIKVTGPDRDLHSGTFGGAVTNPANALAHILDRLLDAETGRVLIPGFYDRVRPVEDWERREFAKLPFDEEAYRQGLGVPALHGEEGYTTLERVWARPTCDVNGIFGGYQGAGAKTVLPSQAGAKVSMRLVPDQDPGEIGRLFGRHVESVAPEGVQVEVTPLHGARPVLIDTSGPLVEAALKALEEVWGKQPVRVREGGSIPIVSTFAQVLEVPVALVGFGLPDDNLHSPNEKFNIPCFYNGVRTTARLLDLAAEAPAGGS